MQAKEGQHPPGAGRVIRSLSFGPFFVASYEGQTCRASQASRLLRMIPGHSAMGACRR